MSTFSIYFMMNLVSILTEINHAMSYILVSPTRYTMAAIKSRPLHEHQTNHAIIRVSTLGQFNWSCFASQFLQGNGKRTRQIFYIVSNYINASL